MRGQHASTHGTVSTSAPLIALVGDRSDASVAHRAIPIALDLASKATGSALAWKWVPTDSIVEPSRDLAEFSAVWVVPASPYRSMDGALGAIRWAREGGRPLLGTCGGFQHMLIEAARDLAGIGGADHEETRPEAEHKIVVVLSCSLVEKMGTVRFAGGSRMMAIYGAPSAVEGYHCNYGFNVRYRSLLEKAGFRFTVWDLEGAVRGAELVDHPFFMGTLYQPERAALRGDLSPLVVAFVKAAVAEGASRPGP